MATLIPEIAFTEFKKLKANQLREMKSCEVMADGKYLFTFVNSKTDYLRVHTENLSQLSNSLGGKTADEILSAEKTNA